jgi:nitrite reductase (NADH) large subunit
VRKADLLATVDSSEGALDSAELFFQYYRENANYLERTYDFVERIGIEKVRKETVYAPEPAREALRDRFARSRSRATDPWLEGRTPKHPTQFIPLRPIEKVNA